MILTVHFPQESPAPVARLPKDMQCSSRYRRPFRGLKRPSSATRAVQAFRRRWVRQLVLLPFQSKQKPHLPVRFPVNNNVTKGGSEGVVYWPGLAREGETEWVKRKEH